jgi:hypothetical protein
VIQALIVALGGLGDCGAGEGRLLDHPLGQDAQLDVGVLGHPAQYLECLFWPAPVLGHDDPFGLLDHRYEPGAALL